jgi:hypothetical protein
MEEPLVRSAGPPTGDNIFRVNISLDDLSLSNNEIVLSLGYTDSKLPDEQVTEMIDVVLSQLSNYCEFRAGYRVFDAYKSPERNDGLLIGGTFFRMQKIVTSQLKKSDKAALFVCSIGPGMENWGRELMLQGEPLLSYVVNTAASIVVEKAVDFLHDQIGLNMKELGFNITNRYSPGYCDWSVAEQHLLFSMLPESFCGVTLTESALMLPIKSISGVVGIGKAVKWKEYICDSCGIKECIYRAKRLTAN